MKVEEFLNVERDEFEKICRKNIDIQKIMTSSLEGYKKHDHMFITVNNETRLILIDKSSGNIMGIPIQLFDSYINKLIKRVLENVLKHYGFYFYADSTFIEHSVAFIYSKIVETKRRTQKYMDSYIIQDFTAPSLENSPVVNDIVNCIYDNRDRFHKEIIYIIKQKFSRYNVLVSYPNNGADRVDDFLIEFSSEEDARWFYNEYKDFVKIEFDKFCKKHVLEKSDMNFEKTGFYEIVLYESLKKQMLFKSTSIVFRLHYKHFVSYSKIVRLKTRSVDGLLERLNYPYIQSILPKTVPFDSESKETMLYSIATYCFNTIYSTVYDIFNYSECVYMYNKTHELFQKIVYDRFGYMVDGVFTSDEELEEFKRMCIEKIGEIIFDNIWLFHGSALLGLKEGPITLRPTVKYDSFDGRKSKNKNSFDSINISIPVVSDKNEVTKWLSDNKKSYQLIIQFLVELHTGQKLNFMRIDNAMLTSGTILIKVSFKSELYKVLE